MQDKITHLLHGLKVVHREGKILGPAQLVHDAAVVQVRSQHLQQPHQLQGVLLKVKGDSLVVYLLVADLRYHVGGKEGGAEGVIGMYYVIIQHFTRYVT